MKKSLAFGLFLAASLVHAEGILLKSGTIDTSRPLPEVEAVDGTAGEIVLVQFPGPVTERQERALREASLRVYAYLPENAFLVRMPAGARRQAQAFGASWTGPYRPAYKMSPQVSAMRAAAKASPEARRIVMLHVFPDADVRDLARRIHDDLGIAGVVGWGQGSFFSRIRLLMTESEIAGHREDLARLGEVFWIDVEARRILLNDTTIWVGQSGLDGGEATPIFDQGIYGEGQIAGVIDTGIDPDMCWFEDPARGLPATNACNRGKAVDREHRKIVAVDFLAENECADGITDREWDTHDHGTHVAGTIAGDDLAHPLAHDPADGMAPGARLVIQDAGFRIDPCGDLPGLGCPVVDLNPIFQQAYDQGARLHSNSWGDREAAEVQNDYSSGSQDVDEFMWKHKDFLIFFAAGNDGSFLPGKVGSPSTAKNGVAVGATLRGERAMELASFSSCGPTADGRIKPDVTVPGVNIVSANNDGNVTTNNCSSQPLSGTSMSAPGATGLTALIRQYYTDGWYPGGRQGSGPGLKPSAALLKATLINSAVPMTGLGFFPVLARCQGWGRVLLDNALYFEGQDRKLQMVDDQKGFRTGQRKSQSIKFKVGSGSGPLKVTLVWTDYPSTPAADRNLVNDLDLAVTGPQGEVWLGNVFEDGESGASGSGGSPDRLNTVEQVQLDHPEPGTYTVTIRPANVPRGRQPFALVVTGDVGAVTRR
ncbi:MAG: S8 family serine peptidase [Acidobacteriota bacterium]